MVGNKYLRWALLNFIILGIWGILLRYLQYHSFGGLNFQFILHGHSHFAFSGWMFLSLGTLIAQISGIGPSNRRMNTVFLLTQICSLGMLVSFSIQGYKAVPIIFSTAFILLTYWFSYLILNNQGFKQHVNPVAKKLVTAAIGFLCLSSLGPFTLAPLMVNGMKNSPLYQNSIYFYLHFQMNGWMILAALGLFVSQYMKKVTFDRKQFFWLKVFIWSSVPLFFIFTLWSGSNPLLISLAAAGAVLHLVAWTKLCLSFKQLFPGLPLLVRTALLAITLKSVLQVLICLPSLGEWVFLNRNLIIGYVHLITLASVTPLILDQLQARNSSWKVPAVAAVNKLYLIGVGLYLALLFGQPTLARFGVHISHFHTCLLLISVLLVIAGILYYRLAVKQQKTIRQVSPRLVESF